MSSRFKNFGFGSKRKSNNLAPQNQNGATPSPPPGANSSSASLPMNNQNQLGRPPSYTYSSPGARPTSPLPPGQPQLAHHHPPPINTGVAYTQPVAPGMPAPAPPYGYPPHGLQHAPIPPSMPQYPARSHTGNELDATGRSKAQLIVGIDFGTTFSGVAFAFATNTEAREDIITEWPGAGSHTKQKVKLIVPCGEF